MLPHVAPRQPGASLFRCASRLPGRAAGRMDAATRSRIGGTASRARVVAGSPGERGACPHRTQTMTSPECVYEVAVAEMGRLVVAGVGVRLPAQNCMTLPPFHALQMPLLG